MTALEDAPKHWTRTTIGEIAEVRLGRQRSPKHHSGESMRSYLRAANVDWYRLRTEDVLEMDFSDEEMKTYALREHDILIVEGSGSATEVGKCALVPEQYAGHAFQNTLIRLRPGDGVDARWLMYRINAEAELGGFLALARGVGIFHLGAKRTSEWPIALPPLDEQHVIVDTIERSLSVVRTGEASLLSANQRLPAVRRAALHRLVQGQELCALAELLDEPLRNGKSVKDGKGMPVLRLSSIRGGVVELRDHKRGLWGSVDPAPFLVQAGDFLVSRGNGTLSLVGRGALVPEGPMQVAFPDTMIRVRPNVARMRPAYLSLVWDSDLVRRQIEAGARTTAGIYKINQELLRTILVPVPEPTEQDHRVSLMADVLARSTRLSRDLTVLHSRASLLRRAILQSALEGRPHEHLSSAPCSVDIEAGVA